MSNTWYKGIHWRASRQEYKVMVSWEGDMLWGTAVSLDAALRLRAKFEKALGKPRTERRIVGRAVGSCITTSGRKDRRRTVVQAHIAPSPGKRLTTTYQLYLPNKPNTTTVQLLRAVTWRKRMEKKYYV